MFCIRALLFEHEALPVEMAFQRHAGLYRHRPTENLVGFSLHCFAAPKVRNNLWRVFLKKAPISSPS